MSRKSKGINAERDLVHAFWGKGYACVRIAGSGSSRYPSADLVVGKGSRKMVVECKATKKDKQYFDKTQIELFKQFATIFGGEPWIAVKFDRKEWSFLKIEELNDSGKNYCISDKKAPIIGRSFEELIAKDI